MPEDVTAQPFFHVPVLSEQVLAGLQIEDGGRYLDATVGGGGHSELILKAARNVELVALDQDLQALSAAKKRLEVWRDRTTFIHTNFSRYEPGGRKFDGILADIGVSSTQLDQAQRGFSFRQEAPLDMRMDSTQELMAKEIVNHWDEKAIADTIYEYGEERLSRRIARRIVEKRPFSTTTELAWEVAGAYPAKARHGRIHPATRTFQALRIAVNGELDVLKTLLAKAPDWLNPGGRLAIISFHSLEDRIVKYAYRGDERLEIITKKPLVATDQEVKENARSRSAKLRIAERRAV
ncbi:S-adenosyl-methyltransferase MraW [Synechococcus sp. PCC 7335]|uniref:16S rRNA (cytosine(1402)-N(4))-methyltransferase RsmH n=1 Tax=Synechococcus sp. (strain ATCC 29403 / PCC 7335) TaxID=91464 RepID=UPI00017EC736|nr:16S rRNA (cytosine(1402)-N(4))-methyltransferase RsmH [Synechococcus sp. PCC 7335]EDX85927.1 S-adenosyl-methyltransferase MraW [Synechococcus sp. PCC 7335]